VLLSRPLCRRRLRRRHCGRNWIWLSSAWAMGMNSAAGGAVAYSVAALQAAAAAQAVSAGEKPAAIDAAAVTASLSYAVSSSQAARTLTRADPLARPAFHFYGAGHTRLLRGHDIVDRISEHDEAVNFLLRPNGRSSGQAVVYIKARRTPSWCTSSRRSRRLDRQAAETSSLCESQARRSAPTGRSAC